MDKKQVIIRVDGNSNIGLGHIYRGIALAEMLKNDFDIRFLTRSDSTIAPIAQAGLNYVFIPEDVKLKEEPNYIAKNISKDSILVLDGYAFDESYQSQIKEFGFKLVYIDDLAKGTQKADLVINHSPSIKESDYVTEPYTKLALGLNYALLRQSFINDNKEVKAFNSKKNILISFGGADPLDLTFQTVSEVIKKDEVEQINVILGAAYSHNKLNEINNSKIVIHKNLSEKEIYDLMSKTDLAIVPASTTSIELASIGVPMALGYFVDNQKEIYKGFIEKKSVHELDDFNLDLNKKLSELDLNSLDIVDYSERLKELFKGNSKKNIISQFKVLSLNIRSIEQEDIKFTFELSNEVQVRKSSFNSDLIDFENHTKWFKRQLDTNTPFYIVEFNGRSFSQVRFNQSDEKYIIGVSIIPEYRGKGYSSIIITMALNKFFEDHKNDVLAFIKKENIASIKAFEKAGFKFYKDELIEGINSLVFIRKYNENR